LASLRDFIIRRVSMSIISALILSAVVFWLMHQVPGDPIDYYMYTNPQHFRDPIYVETMIERMGLNKPVHIQYIMWLKGVLTGDLGRSFITSQEIKDMIAPRIPHTIYLAILSNIFTLAIAIPLGVICAVKRHSKTDNAAMLFSIFGISLPSYWFGMILLYVFSLRFGIFPVGGTQSLTLISPDIWTRIWDLLIHLVLPVIAL